MNIRRFKKPNSRRDNPFLGGKKETRDKKLLGTFETWADEACYKEESAGMSRNQWSSSQTRAVALITQWNLGGSKMQS